MKTETEETFETSHHRGVPVVIGGNKRQDTRTIPVRRVTSKTECEIIEIDKDYFISEWLKLVLKLFPLYPYEGGRKGNLSDKLNELIAEVRFAAGEQFEKIYAGNVAMTDTPCEKLVDVNKYGYTDDARGKGELPSIRTKRGVIL